MISVAQGLANADCVSTGEDGISDTAASGDDVQRIPVGNGEPYAIGITDGGDGFLDCVGVSCPGGDDVQQIPVGNGLPNQVTIDDGGDGALLTAPGGDDVNVGLTITTGPNGVSESRAVAGIIGSPSVMTSDVLVPVPSTYRTDDLDQVRFHLKHP